MVHPVAAALADQLFVAMQERLSLKSDKLAFAIVASGHFAVQYDS
jgi:hypothetical protein